MHLRGGQRGAQPAPPGLLDRPDVVDAAVTVEVVRQRRRDHLAVDAGGQQVEGGVVGMLEEIGRQAVHPQIFGPAGRAQRDLRARHADVIEGHAHGPAHGRSPDWSGIGLTPRESGVKRSRYRETSRWAQRPSDVRLTITIDPDDVRGYSSPGPGEGELLERLRAGD